MPTFCEITQVWQYYTCVLANITFKYLSESVVFVCVFYTITQKVIEIWFWIGVTLSEQMVDKFKHLLEFLTKLICEVPIR